jgi:hypothetical protein
MTSRLVSEQPLASLLTEGSRLDAVSKFVSLDVSDFDHSLLPTLTPLFRTFVAGSDDSECDRAIGQHSPIAQITLSSIMLCLSLRDADVSHASWNETLQKCQPVRGA